MLIVRVKREDAVFINGKKFIVSKLSPRFCEFWDKETAFNIWFEGSTLIEGLDVHYREWDNGYARIGFDGDRSIKVESEGLHRKRQNGNLVKSFYGNA